MAAAPHTHTHNCVQTVWLSVFSNASFHALPEGVPACLLCVCVCVSKFLHCCRRQTLYFLAALLSWARLYSMCLSAAVVTTVRKQTPQPIIIIIAKWVTRRANTYWIGYHVAVVNINRGCFAFIPCLFDAGFSMNDASRDVAPSFSQCSNFVAKIRQAIGLSRGFKYWC